MLTRTIKVSIPPAFAVDHSDRDLPTGIKIEETKTGWTFKVTVEEYREWLSDARHYSDCAGQGWSMDGALGLQSSARATVKRLEALTMDFLIESDKFYLEDENYMVLVGDFPESSEGAAI